MQVINSVRLLNATGNSTGFIIQPERYIQLVYVSSTPACLREYVCVNMAIHVSYLTLVRIH